MVLNAKNITFEESALWHFQTLRFDMRESVSTSGSEELGNSLKFAGGLGFGFQARIGMVKFWIFKLVGLPSKLRERVPL